MQHIVRNTQSYSPIQFGNLAPSYVSNLVLKYSWLDVNDSRAYSMARLLISKPAIEEGFRYLATNWRNAPLPQPMSKTRCLSGKIFNSWSNGHISGRYISLTRSRRPWLRPYLSLKKSTNSACVTDCIAFNSCRFSGQ